MPARRIIGKFGKKKRTVGHAYLQHQQGRGWWEHDVKISNASAKNLKRGRGASKAKPLIGKTARKTNIQKAPSWDRCENRHAKFGRCQRPKGHGSQHTYA